MTNSTSLLWISCHEPNLTVPQRVELCWKIGEGGRGGDGESGRARFAQQQNILAAIIQHIPLSLYHQELSIIGPGSRWTVILLITLSSLTPDRGRR